MAGKVQEVRDLINRNSVAADISNKYESWLLQRRPWTEEKKELRNYIFATDTTSTSNSSLPWKNKTTLPKLCQIRDNLHANYMAAWFASEEWMDWEGGDDASDTKAKQQAIKAYMKNKLQEGEFRQVVSKLAYDYIDTGNVFAEVVYVNESKEDPLTGEMIDGYVGPKMVRKSPYEMVFNLAAPSFRESPTITRYIKTVGELKQELEERPDLGYNADIISHIENVRAAVGSFSSVDIDKSQGYSIDGFGTLQEYYQSGYVEILEFEGDLHDQEGRYLKDQIVTVVDRTHLVRMETSPSWIGKTNKLHTAWRERPDNLMGMGPLDNLVGMQYRIDHLENLKADAMDLLVFPMKKIKGNVEDFDWEPGGDIYLGDDGDVTTLSVPSEIVGANNEIAILEQKMEEMAGAPRQAMGIRTPGEKTLGEVQALENASGRIFQDKTTDFELNIIEPALNLMLEMSRRNMNGEDLVRIMDDDIGVAAFLSVTKSDITARGKLRARGARHFAAQAILMQNLNLVYNSPLGQAITPHVSTIRLSELVVEILGLERMGLVKPNIGLLEQADSQRLVNSLQDQLETEQMTPTDAPPPGGL